MTNIGEVQRLFWDAIVHPSGVDDFLNEADDATRARFDAVFAESATFSRRDRLQVYAEAYFYRLLDVMAETFPVVRGFVGGTAYHNLITDYVLHHPSRDPDLHRLGAPFPEFLSRHPTTAGRPYLAEFAQIELALTHAIDAKDAPVLTRSELTALSPEALLNLRLTLPPAVTLVPTRYDMKPAHQALNDGQPFPAVTPLETTLTAVWRQGHRAYFRYLPEEEATLLATLKPKDDEKPGESSPATFTSLSQRAETLGFTPQHVVHCVLRWVDVQLVTGERCA